MEPLKKANEILEYFEGRREFAAQHLSGLSGEEGLCFALSGLAIEGGSFEFEGVAKLRPVQNPPGEIELAKALMDKSFLSPVARHMPPVTYELAVYRSASRDQQHLMNLGWWITGAMRCRSLTDVLVPVVSSVSWDGIAAVEADTCSVWLLEDVPSARRFGDSIVVSQEDLRWVHENLITWIDLLERPAFRLAVDSLTTHHQQANLRMTAAALWAGFEALFSISSELRFRLSALVASYLEPRGASRVILYKRMKTLYDYRSRAVHGAATSDSLLQSHIIETRGILSRLLCRMVEAKLLPSTEQFEEYLFT